MTEDLMESVAPQLAPPVTRQPAGAATSGEEVGQSVFGITIGGFTFADESAE